MKVICPSSDIIKEVVSALLSDAEFTEYYSYTFKKLSLTSTLDTSWYKALDHTFTNKEDCIIRLLVYVASQVGDGDLSAEEYCDLIKKYCQLLIIYDKLVLFLQDRGIKVRSCCLSINPGYPSSVKLGRVEYSGKLFDVRIRPDNQSVLNNDLTGVELAICVGDVGMSAPAPKKLVGISNLPHDVVEELKNNL